MPSSIYTDMQENWAKYVAGAATREEFLERYQQIFKDYNDGIYGWLQCQNYRLREAKAL